MESRLSGENPRRIGKPIRDRIINGRDTCGSLIKSRRNAQVLNSTGHSSESRHRLRVYLHVPFGPAKSEFLPEFHLA